MHTISPVLTSRIPAAALVLLVLALTACGGSDQAVTPADTAATEDAGTDTATPACTIQSDCPDPLDLCIAGACVPQTACKSDKQCGTLGLVCDQAAGVCVQCLLDQDCADGQTCKAKTCQAAAQTCASSKECPPGQVCHPDDGVCVGCVDDDDCEDAEFCTETLCKPDVCEAGTAACADAATRKVCAANGSVWSEAKCPEGQTCLGGACAQQVCTPGVKACAEGENGLATCNDSGTAWNLADACPSGSTCKEAVCQSHVCTPSSQKCNAAGGLDTCAADGLSLASGPCPATRDGKAQSCVVKDGVDVCAAQVCPAGTSYCDQGKAMACAGDGMSSNLVADCSQPGPDGKPRVCLNGGCVAAACKAGDKLCADAATLATCKSSGDGWDKTACGANQGCDAGACLSLICAPGVASCAGQKAELCNGSGTAKALVEDCGTKKVCQSGACKAKVCTPGMVQCQGGQVGVCNEDGTGWTQTPCGSGQTCTGGKCVAKVCEPGGMTCNGLTVAACNGSGTAWVSVQDCKLTNETCLDGKCVASACAPGTLACDGKKIVQCNGSGTAWTAGEDCAVGGKVCIGGKCESAVCAPGALKCEVQQGAGMQRGRDRVGGWRGLRRVQGCEVEPIGFNFRALSHFKTHGAKNFFNALQSQRHGVQTALRQCTPRQAHIQSFGFELQGQLSIGQGLTLSVQSGFNGLLGHIHCGAKPLLFFHAQCGHALHQLGDAARFSQIKRLGIFKIGRSLRLGKTGAGLLNQTVQLVHGDALICLEIDFKIHSNKKRIEAFASLNPFLRNA